MTDNQFIRSWSRAYEMSEHVVQEIFQQYAERSDWRRISRHATDDEKWAIVSGAFAHAPDSVGTLRWGDQEFHRATVECVPVEDALVKMEQIMEDTAAREDVADAIGAVKPPESPATKDDDVRFGRWLSHLMLGLATQAAPKICPEDIGVKGFDTGVIQLTIDLHAALRRSLVDNAAFFTTFEIPLKRLAELLAYAAKEKTGD